jgi:Fe-S-cluster containining protein
MGKHGKKDKSGNRTQELLKDVRLPYPMAVPGGPPEAKLVEYSIEAARIFMEPLRDHLTEGSLREGTKRLYRYLDQLLATLPTTVTFSDAGRVSIACKPGCNYCCSARVTCTAPTVLFIADHLRRSRTDDQMVALKARIQEHENRIAKLSPYEVLLKTELCPLNESGLCTIYDLRPITCRGYHSFDLAKCIEEFNDPGEEPRVPQHPARKTLEAIVSSALLACSTALGLDTDELEFVTAIAIAIDQPDAATRYIAGESVFASAKRPDVLEAQRIAIRNKGSMQLVVRNE